MKVEEVLACSLPTWYSNFEKVSGKRNTWPELDIFYLAGHFQKQRNSANRRGSRIPDGQRAASLAERM